ncbi:hypothetical protein VTN49DRAFT_944 [Thermomyces lanuginosus]|uniref:uncharacterized protein n=1 Tax=Thermomyces lanuginosus TaxID=5541 RepID=UPI003743D7E7
MVSYCSNVGGPRGNPVRFQDLAFHPCSGCDLAASIGHWVLADFHDEPPPTSRRRRLHKAPKPKARISISGRGVMVPN